MNNFVKCVGSDGPGTATKECAFSVTLLNLRNECHSLIKVVPTGYEHEESYEWRG